MRLFLITAQTGRKLLTDPWYHDGAGHGILFNFPPLTDQTRERYLSTTPDYIYISHLHDDHLDPIALGRFDKATPVIIGQLKYKHLLHAIVAAGFTNVIECPLDEPVSLDGLSIVINDQFPGSSDGHPDQTDYVLDTSIVVKDSLHTLYFAVDNPIKESDAEGLRERFPQITTAILPYSGASPYPHVYTRYTYEEKVRKRDSIKAQKLHKFCRLAEILSPDWAIPAAGSFVIGGKAAHVSEFGHQPTPAEVQSYWNEKFRGSASLCLMRTGDVLDMETGDHAFAPVSDFHDFTHEDRVRYALSTKSHPSPFDQISFPTALRFPWRRLAQIARANMWRHQQSMNIALPIDVIFEVMSTPSLGLNDRHSLRFEFALDAENLFERAHDDYVMFRMDASVFYTVLLGSVVWGNVEYLIEMDRQPDEFNPTIHTLMAFFRI